MGVSLLGVEPTGVDRFFRSIGLSRGSIQIVLPHTQFCLGESIDGTVAYSLKSPAEGKRLWIEVKACQTVTEPKVEQVQRDGRWVREVRRSTRTHILYEYRTDLDHNAYYDQGTYTFSLPLPRHFADLTPDSDLVKVAEMAQTFYSGIAVTRGPVKWTLETKLEIPWSLGVSAKLNIHVHDRVAAQPSGPRARPEPAPPARPEPTPTQPVRPPPTRNPGGASTQTQVLWRLRHSARTRRSVLHGMRSEV